jgi:YegS/Rv2252/BmrU family lipid kinase
MVTSDPNRVLVLINPNSGLGVSIRVLLNTFQDVWDQGERTVSYQMSKNTADGKRKVEQAVKDGIGTIIVVGGDGMINTIGQLLLDTEIQFGVIPTGSGNGFARHFDIPLNPTKAIQTLATASSRKIDVGTANGRPFFVTCSLALDAAIVKSFEKSPVRGILPYIFAATYELFDYKPELFEIELDNEPRKQIEYPMLFTIANLTQYGGGAVIAPRAKADDGFLWLTYACKSQVPRLIPQLPQLFNGKIEKAQGIEITKFTRCIVYRETAQPIQVDGELMESPAKVEINIRPRALRVLTPYKTENS